MKKRIFSRILALVMAVSLLSTTAFAASFADLQGAINGTDGTVDNPAGYAQHDDGTYGISAWTDNGIRNVQLNENVVYGDGGAKDNKPISVSQNVTLDLNSHDIDGKGKSGSGVITVTNGNLTVTDNSEGEKTGSITGGKKHGIYSQNGDVTVSNVAITDNKESGVVVENGNFSVTDSTISGNIRDAVSVKNGNATITGSTITGAENSIGNGVHVGKGSFTVSGSTISGNGNAGIRVDDGQGKDSTISTSTITGNKGNGIAVKKGNLIMNNDVQITNNDATVCQTTSHGGGVFVSGGNFTMNGGTISGNKGKYGGGVVVSGGQFTMVQGTITENTATSYMGGGVWMADKGIFNMQGGSITKNHVTSKGSRPYDEPYGGGGVFLNGDSQLNMSGGEISENDAVETGGGVHANHGKITLSGNAVIGNNTTTDNRGNDISVRVSELDASSGRFDGRRVEFWCGTKLINNGFTVTISIEDKTVSIVDAEGNTVAALQDANGNRINAGALAEGVETLIVTLPLSAIPSVPDEDDGNPSDTDTTPDNATPVPDGAETLADTTTIEDEETPLAGLVSIAQLLEELRQYEGIEDIELPEDFQWIDHEFAQAIYWGLDEALVVDTEDDPLDPDEIVTVAMYREVLENYVAYKGLTDFVVTVDGEDDEIVFDLGERLTVFYGELEAALEAKAA